MKKNLVLKKEKECRVGAIIFDLRKLVNMFFSNYFPKNINSMHFKDSTIGWKSNILRKK